MKVPVKSTKKEKKIIDEIKSLSDEKIKQDIIFETVRNNYLYTGRMLLTSRMKSFLKQKEMSNMHMAIEFAKHLLRGKISNKRMGKIEEETPGEEYQPWVFKLLLGELEHKGEELFEEWMSVGLCELCYKPSTLVNHHLCKDCQTKTSKSNKGSGQR